MRMLADGRKDFWIFRITTDSYVGPWQLGCLANSCSWQLPAGNCSVGLHLSAYSQRGYLKHVVSAV